MARWNGFWTRRTDVQRVELYTRVSLYVLVWWVGLSVVAFRPGELASPRTALLLAVAVVLTALAATLGLRVAMDQVRPRLDDPRVRRATALNVVAALVALGLAFALPQDDRGLVVTVVAGTLAWGVGAVRGRAAVALGPVVLVGGAVALFGIGASPAALVWLGVYAFFVFTLRSSLWLLAVVRELDQARQAQSRLAIAEERLRFSRDVHDVLGRHLSTIAVQAELASRLAERGDERAAATMLEVRAAAHEALREARALARGYRPVDLGTELEGARSLVRSAGIDWHEDLDDLPPRWREPVGWVVREAVTNVLRHSTATRVAVRWERRPEGAGGAGSLVVRNDGARPADPAHRGTGLVGLAERLAPTGATLDTARQDDDFVLRVDFPAETAAGRGEEPA
ncbi:sensor histidine kinase [Nocardioides zeae]|uniref:Sensor histidine kinase n=1 Tax=Nocardioides zeae TaxID=1457234 RepID=A0A6P0HFB6_9ACTN|nr:histidine kinase [Nocardioides zeae]NEN77388.1 sensor histidine kinase [Nocardioides zeae]